MPSFNPHVWGTVGQWFAAGATFSAVLVALFGEKIRAWLMPPKLCIELESSAGESEQTVLTWRDEDGADHSRPVACRMYRIIVRNGRRWSPARGVRLYVRELQEQAADGRWTVTWRGFLPLSWTHQQIFPDSRDIGHPAQCDLLMAVQNKWVALQPVLVPLSLEVRKRWGFKWRLAIQAQSIEADSNFLQVEVSWNGEWSADSEVMRRHLVVAPVGPD